jgi:hypothetical protein
VLTLTLKDGTTVSGKVTETTEIECQTPPPATTPAGGSGDDNGDSQSDGQSDQSSQDSQNMSNGSDDNGQGDDNQGDDDQDQNNGPAQCTTSALVAGAVVDEAILRIDSTGAEFKRIELAG